MSMFFQCARCKRIFREDEHALDEALGQLKKDFDTSLKALQKSGGLSKVCIPCYNEVMNQGHNTPKQSHGNPTYRIFDATKNSKK